MATIHKTDFDKAASGANQNSAAFEDEIKFLCESTDTSLINPALEHLRINNYLLTDPKTEHKYLLISSQYDFDNLSLYNRGITLRVRSTFDHATETLKTSEVTLKVNLQSSGVNGLRRFEYSASQDGHGRPDLEALKHAYPLEPNEQGVIPLENIALHDLINKEIAPYEAQLDKHFNINCTRHRRVVFLNADQLGLQDQSKTFATEFIHDEVSYSGKTGKQVGHHIEWESEVLTHICKYNRFEGDDQYITRNLSEAEIGIGQQIVRYAMGLAAKSAPDHVNISETMIGKAERGFPVIIAANNNCIERKSAAIAAQ